MCGRFVEINHAKQQINAFSGNLFIPLTNRHKGYVMSYEDASSGKKRRYYQLTEAGRHHSSEKKQEWMTYQSAVTNVLSMEGGC